MKNKTKPNLLATTPEVRPTTMEFVKELKTTAKKLYRDTTLYHLADLLSDSADRLEAYYQAFIFICSDREVPEDVRRKLL